jgi:predicted regulator of Ras-like GTPase activity (Roadblock/LC7/MglB family)
MAKKKKSIRETTETVMIESEATVQAVEEDPTFASLRTSLTEISKCEGVTGYILRNAVSAVIDLKDPTKLADYAIMSSQAIDSSKEFSELFGLGDIENVLIEGKDAKILCLTVGENRVSVFMEKDADHKHIRKQISPIPTKS